MEAEDAIVPEEQQKREVQEALEKALNFWSDGFSVVIEKFRQEDEQTASMLAVCEDDCYGRVKYSIPMEYRQRVVKGKDKIRIVLCEDPEMSTFPTPEVVYMYLWAKERSHARKYKEEAERKIKALEKVKKEVANAGSE